VRRDPSINLALRLNLTGRNARVDVLEYLARSNARDILDSLGKAVDACSQWRRDRNDTQDYE
jgi:hypothetical protein